MNYGYYIFDNVHVISLYIILYRFYFNPLSYLFHTHDHFIIFYGKIFIIPFFLESFKLYYWLSLLLQLVLLIGKLLYSSIYIYIYSTYLLILIPFFLFRISSKIVSETMREYNFFLGALNGAAYCFLYGIILLVRYKTGIVPKDHISYVWNHRYE